MNNLIVCLEVASVPRSVSWYQKVGFRVSKRGRLEATVAYEGAKVELTIPPTPKPRTTKGLTLQWYVSDLSKVYQRLVRNRLKISGCSFCPPKQKSDPLYDTLRNGNKLPPVATLVQAGLLCSIGLNDPDGHYWLILDKRTK